MYRTGEINRDDQEMTKRAPQARRNKRKKYNPLRLYLSENQMTEFRPLHFYDQIIEVHFVTPPPLEKTPPCPNGFSWNGQAYRVAEMLAEWSDFTRRGKMARNMRPSHAVVASGRGSLGVGRFYFRVRVDTNQIFDLYYDRAPQDADRRKGQWFLYRELVEGD